MERRPPRNEPAGCNRRVLFYSEGGAVAALVRWLREGPPHSLGRDLPLAWKGARGSAGSLEGRPAMATLTIPSLEWRFLKEVSEEAKVKPASEWPEETLQLCLVLLQTVRVSTSRQRREVETLLADGVEARSFIQTYGPHLLTARDFILKLRETAVEIGETGQ